MRLTCSLTTAARLALVLLLGQLAAARRYTNYTNWYQLDRGPIRLDSMADKYRDAMATLELDRIYYWGCIFTNQRVLLCHTTEENKLPTNYKDLVIRLGKKMLKGDPGVLSNLKIIKRSTFQGTFQLGYTYQAETFEKLTLDRDLDLEPVQKYTVQFYNKDNWDRTHVALAGPNYRCGLHLHDNLPIKRLSTSNNNYRFFINDPEHVCPPSRSGDFIYAPSAADVAPILVGLATNKASERDSEWLYDFVPFHNRGWLSWP